eukprot:4980967-Pyramimonas_sp.AAC.1
MTQRPRFWARRAKMSPIFRLSEGRCPPIWGALPFKCPRFWAPREGRCLPSSALRDRLRCARDKRHDSFCNSGNAWRRNANV